MPVKARGAWTVLTAALLAAGCGGGGGGDVTQPSVCLGFTAGRSPAAGTVTTRAGAGASCSALPLEIVATGVSDVYAASFRMTWDASVAEFVSASADGSRLADGGANVQVLAEPSPGAVLVGVTRTGTAAAVDFPGTGLLVRVTLRPTGPGTSAVRFEQAKLLDAATPPREKGGVTWSGGTLDAR